MWFWVFIVEPAPGVDLEGVEVAKECLADAFKLDLSVDRPEECDCLVDIFGSRDSVLRHGINQLSADAPSTSNVADAANHEAMPQFQVLFV